MYVQKTLYASGVHAGDEEGMFIESDRKDSLDYQAEREQRRLEFEYNQKMASLRSQVAGFDDLKRVTLRRSKIEQWVEEPFFEQTMKKAFVKVGFSQKYIIA
jgi:hypothetical protein